MYSAPVILFFALFLTAPVLRRLVPHPITATKPRAATANASSPIIWARYRAWAAAYRRGQTTAWLSEPRPASLPAHAHTRCLKRPPGSTLREIGYTQQQAPAIFTLDPAQPDMGIYG